MCNKTCIDVTFIESPAPVKQLFSARTAVKNQSPLQRMGHCNIRSMFPKAAKQTPEQVSLDHVVETKMELQEHEEAWKCLRLQALKDKYDSAACIKLSAQASIKNITWSLQQNVATEASGLRKQPNGQEAKDEYSMPEGVEGALEDIEMEVTDLTSPISNVEQVPPVVQRGSIHRIATKVTKLAKQLKEQEEIAADTVAFALALKEREHIVNDLSLQNKTPEESDPATPAPDPRSTSSTQGGGTSRTNFFTDLAAVHWDVQGRTFNTPPSDVTPSLSATDSLSGIFLLTNPAVYSAVQSVLNTPNYPSVPHGRLPENEICDDNQEEDKYHSLSCRYALGSKVTSGFCRLV
jgi:hypothetical protein